MCQDWRKIGRGQPRCGGGDIAPGRYYRSEKVRTDPTKKKKKKNAAMGRLSTRGKKKLRSGKGESGGASRNFVKKQGSQREKIRLEANRQDTMRQSGKRSVTQCEKLRAKKKNHDKPITSGGQIESKKRPTGEGKVEASKGCEKKVLNLISSAGGSRRKQIVWKWWRFESLKKSLPSKSGIRGLVVWCPGNTRDHLLLKKKGDDGRRASTFTRGERKTIPEIFTIGMGG